MKNIALNSFLTAFIVWSGGVFVWGFEWLVVGIVAIPILATVCMIALFCIDYIFAKFPILRKAGVALGAMGGCGFGFIAYIVLFNPGEISHILAFQYSLLGSLMGGLSVILYLWGPLKPRSTADKMYERD